MNDLAIAMAVEADSIASDAKRGTEHEQHEGWHFTTKDKYVMRCGCGDILVEVEK